ncbi:DUF5343 domain-containing protein [Nucisporomicrobium flavum]|uniref:DUF5343 domain-containing protein n=1 Tax=Nucisporomicrobium flavum TaxID=2785915 RepID=UPI0018F2A005|nr:DUF5343 domain-containing protein [Nucisporomicrobium flavum]
MLSSRYLVSTKNVDAILKKIVDGVAPDKFTNEHLKSIGFTSSSDRGIIPVLKDLGFLGGDGTPQPRYHNYRDRSRSGAVLAEALREAYSDIFHIREVPTTTDRPAVEGLFRSKLNSSDRVSQQQAATFYALLKNADLQAQSPAGATIPPVKKATPAVEDASERNEASSSPAGRPSLKPELHYTIQIHLPATKDIEVFNAIFQSLRSNLLS